jgi:hypothetical protein
MSDQVVGQPGLQSLALAEPTQHVRYRWIVGLTLASLPQARDRPRTSASSTSPSSAQGPSAR